MEDENNNAKQGSNSRWDSSATEEEKQEISRIQGPPVPASTSSQKLTFRNLFDSDSPVENNQGADYRATVSESNEEGKGHRSERHVQGHNIARLDPDARAQDQDNADEGSAEFTEVFPGAVRILGVASTEMHHGTDEEVLNQEHDDITVRSRSSTLSPLQVEAQLVDTHDIDLIVNERVNRELQERLNREMRERKRIVAAEVVAAKKICFVPRNVLYSILAVVILVAMVNGVSLGVLRSKSSSAASPLGSSTVSPKGSLITTQTAAPIQSATASPAATEAANIPTQLSTTEIPTPTPTSPTAAATIETPTIMPTTAKIAPTKQIVAAANCPVGRSPVIFEVLALLDLIGILGLISEADVASLEENFVIAYNDLLKCPLSGTGRTLINATIIQANSSTGSSVQRFRFLVIAQGRDCNFCASNSSIDLFSNVSISGFQNRTRQRELPQMIDGKTFGVDADLLEQAEVPDDDLVRLGVAHNLREQSGDNDLKAVKTHGNITRHFRLPSDESQEHPATTIDWRRFLQNNGCDCQGPSPSAFTSLLSLLLNSSVINAGAASAFGGLAAISGVAGATQLLPITGCNPNKRSDFNATLILQFPAAATYYLTQLNLLTIGNVLVKSYKAVNGLSKQVCDPYFRQITTIQYQGLGQRRLANGAVHSNPMVNVSAGAVFNVSYNVPVDTSVVDLVFLIGGTCLGCPADLSLFDGAFRRKMQQNNPFPSLTTTATVSGDTACLCPQGAVFNSRYGRSGASQSSICMF